MKSRRRFCTSSVQREIRQKKRDKSLFWLIKLIAFVTFPLPSTTSDLKVPIQ